MESAFKTDKGRIRQHNEDHGGVFENSSRDRLAVVADGMGGHNAGDVASNIAIDQLQSSWEKVEYISSPEEAEEWLKQAIETVNRQIFSHSRENIECQGMGTTLVAVISTDRFCTIAHIGDSRCYILNESGFTLLTEDHSLVNELVRTGQISKEAAEHHPRKNVLTRALGTEEQVVADYRTISFEAGDYLLLCSDGLSNKMTDEEMALILQMDLSLSDKAEKLVNLANENGGEDNITIVILQQSADCESG
ncbi:Stp1/IreP family PP2C-type Ser/Thr phosphatase [Oikeobacillus pervagus]|nr:Stp1/IreP family PP2C-type Ser/Thr phosphatase [Oikeobacillus pervagus]